MYPLSCKMACVRHLWMMFPYSKVETSQQALFLFTCNMCTHYCPLWCGELLPPCGHADSFWGPGEVSHGSKPLYLSLFFIFLFYQIVSTLKMEQTQSFPEQKKVSLRLQRESVDKPQEQNCVFDRSCIQTHDSHGSATCSALCPPPSSPLCSIPDPPLSVLKSFETHMWADGLMSHHTEAVSACSADNDGSLQTAVFCQCPPRVCVHLRVLAG